MITCTSKPTKPIYQHGCTECVHLGSSEVVDFYFHDNTNSVYKSPTLIARYSDQPPDFYSIKADICRQLVEDEGLDENSVLALCYKRYLNFMKQT